MPFGQAKTLGYTNPVNNQVIIVEPVSGTGLFFYSPSLGLGNLVASWTTLSGTDQYGNTYPAGLSLSGEPILLYSGTPAFGNLILSLSPTAGTDVYGNVYPQGLNVTIGTISGSIISGSIFNGSDFTINSLGEFFYSGTLPSALNANPYFTNGSTTGWSGFNGTFSVTGSPPTGAPYPYAGKYVNNGVTTGAMEELTGPFAITPGSEYVVSTWVYSSNPTVQLGFDYLNSGSYVATRTQNITVPVNTWSLISTTQTCPASGVNQSYPRIGTATPTGATIYAEAVTCYAAKQKFILEWSGTYAPDPGKCYAQ